MRASLNYTSFSSDDGGIVGSDDGDGRDDQDEDEAEDEDEDEDEEADDPDDSRRRRVRRALAAALLLLSFSHVIAAPGPLLAFKWSSLSGEKIYITCLRLSTYRPLYFVLTLIFYGSFKGSLVLANLLIIGIKVWA